MSRHAVLPADRGHPHVVGERPDAVRRAVRVHRCGVVAWGLGTDPGPAASHRLGVHALLGAVCLDAGAGASVEDARDAVVPGGVVVDAEPLRGAAPDDLHTWAANGLLVPIPIHPLGWMRIRSRGWLPRLGLVVEISGATLVRPRKLLPLPAIASLPPTLHAVLGGAACAAAAVPATAATASGGPARSRWRRVLTGVARRRARGPCAGRGILRARTAGCRGRSATCAPRPRSGWPGRSRPGGSR